jgi:broad specificity phosphatase PhoE
MIALVSHGGTLRVILAYLLGLPVGRKPPLKVSGNTGLTIAEMTSAGRFITLLNDCSHLDHEQGRSNYGPHSGELTGEGAESTGHTIG